VRVFVALDQRFFGLADGSVWTATVYDYEFWLRYLRVFDEVVVVARVRICDDVNPVWLRVDGPGVRVHPVVHYLGAVQFLGSLPRLNSGIASAVEPGSAYILRVSSVVASLLARRLRALGCPFALEVGGDPWEALAPGAVRSVVRPLARRLLTRDLKRLCREACAVSYVTKHLLQSRYPATYLAAGLSDVDLPSESIADNAPFQTYYSTVDLNAAALASNPNCDSPRACVSRIVFVGSLAQMYKGPDILLHALRLCHNRGADYSLVMIGEGRHRGELEALARKLGLQDMVQFLGELPRGAPIRAQLDQADLFVLPSRTEGLPRAMIEAMARGMPCIGSSAGGTPELLDQEDLVPPGDPRFLAAKIMEVASDPERLARMAMRNLARASEYSDASMRVRRDEYYSYVRDFTAKHLLARRAG
jgi:glycosyltransferase involved in cell wall biosynthesis